MFTPELLEGARNLVVSYGGIKSGDEVIILAEFGHADQAVIDAESAICTEVGAKAHVIWTPALRQTWWEDLSAVTRGAIAAADVLLQNVGTIGRTHLLDLMLNNGVRRIRNYATDVAVLSSEWARFPVDVQSMIELKVNTTFANAKQWRVTTPDGTDLSGEVVPRIAPWRVNITRAGGMNVTFPPGVFRATEATSTNGTMMVRSTYPWGARRVGLNEVRFEQPVKLVVENNLVVAIEGGWEADAFRTLFEENVPSLGENAYKMDSFHSGSSPKAFQPSAPQLDPNRFDHLIHEHESWFHFHIGSQSDKRADLTQKVEHVNAVPSTNSTVYLDGEKLWENGRMTVWSDEELVKAAAPHGGAAALFAQRPIWWG
jgi:hypothetical protein